MSPMIGDYIHKTNVGRHMIERMKKNSALAHLIEWRGTYPLKKTKEGRHMIERMKTNAPLRT